MNKPFKRITAERIGYLATDRTSFASLHPFVYTAKMEMMRALSHYLGVFRCIFCK